jgi:homoserine O-acetyltransferase
MRAIDSRTRTITLADSVDLEFGGCLDEVRVAFRTWGCLDSARSNAVLVCHALTGSADADRWWPGLFGTGKTLDPGRDFIICSNVLGSCYGTSGPTSPTPGGTGHYGSDFPEVSIRDMVEVQRLLLDSLGIRRLRLVIGGSLGGMQALEWAVGAPDRVDAAIAVATSGRHSPWCIAVSEAQRAAIRADAAWRGGHYPADRPPEHGLGAARMMAMCTYRNQAVFSERFGRAQTPEGVFQSESYLHHHASKLARRFDANAYITLTRAMDSHDLGRGRGQYDNVLAGITVPILVVAISSDMLYPPREQQELASWIPRSHLAELHSPHGHDAFLIDTEELDSHIRHFQSTHLRRRLAS